jgi:hypothetical protein
MYSVDAFLSSFSGECRRCVRLFGKMPPGGLDYRPTPGQRSTLELLRYITRGPYNGVRRIVAGDWTLGPPAAEATKEMPPSDFPRAMLRQGEEVQRLLRATDPGKLETETFTFPWGETLKKGEALVEHPLKWLTGYKTQLFLYLKAAGAKELGTPDLWHPAKDTP